MKKTNGFTLIEVMVAVAVIAIALPALLFSMMNQIDGASHLRDKLQAGWVADNKLAELRLNNRLLKQLPQKKATGEESLGGREWSWEYETREAEFNMYWVQLHVWGDNEEEKGAPLLTRTIAVLAPVTEEIKTPQAPPGLEVAAPNTGSNDTSNDAAEDNNVGEG